MRRVGVLVVFFLFLAVALAAAQDNNEFEKMPTDVQQGQIAAPKPKVNNLPFNVYGLSGLMVTTATRTLVPGSFEVGLAGEYLNASRPHYYDGLYSFLFGVGIPGGLEFGLRVPYEMTNLLITPHRSRYFNEPYDTYSKSAAAGLASVEGMFKWGFVQQHNFLPAFSLGVGGIAPTNNYSQFLDDNDVHTYGLKVQLAMGLELNDLGFTDYAFAILADGTLVLRDIGVDNHKYEEKHGLVHGGMIFPLHPRNFLELLLEYEGDLMRGTANDQNIENVIASLRFVHYHFNVTAGVKFSFWQNPDFADQLTYMATFSYTYF
jgi:hypothetical protein